MQLVQLVLLRLGAVGAVGAAGGVGAPTPNLQHVHICLKVANYKRVAIEKEIYTEVNK